MRRTDLMDTADWAHREMTRRLRAMTPSQRLANTLDLVQMGMEIQLLARGRSQSERLEFKMTNPHQILKSLFAKLEDLEVRYMVGGSFASSAHGVSRQTNDLDLVIDLMPPKVDPFVAALEGEFMLSRNDIADALASTDPFRSAQLLHFEALFKVDLYLLNEDPFSQSEMFRRTELELLPGVVAWTKSAEDILLRKLLWFELGNRVSDRQWNDIVGLIEVQHERLDLGYVIEWADRLNVRELLESALAQALPD